MHDTGSESDKTPADPPTVAVTLSTGHEADDEADEAKRVKADEAKRVKADDEADEAKRVKADDEADEAEDMDDGEMKTKHNSTRPRSRSRSKRG
jgi:hypothetical protein